MSDNAQTLHRDVHVSSFLLYSISLDLKVEDAKGREKDGVEHCGNGKQSYAVQKDSQATLAIPSMPVKLSRSQNACKEIVLSSQAAL